MRHRKASGTRRSGRNVCFGNRPFDSLSAHRHMNQFKCLLYIVVAAFAAGCTTTPAPSDQPASQGTAAPTANGTTVKSRDGSYSGEVIGKAVAGSKFSRLQIGMQVEEVQQILGRSPDRSHTYESGKRWIPFYFGNDARRMQALYTGEGCLIFASGNPWGGAGGDLIGIEHDASGACYQP